MFADNYSESVVYEFGCHCQTLIYRYSGQPYCCYTCHCTDCQRASGSAFTSNMIVAVNDIALVSGSASEFCYPHNNDHLHVTCCKDCGTDLFLYFRSRSSTATILTGTFFDQQWFSPVAHIWTRIAVAWLKLDDGLPCYQEQPVWEDLAALWKSRHNKP